VVQTLYTLAVLFILWTLIRSTLALNPDDEI
jgi:hypothetical protein